MAICVTGSGGFIGRALLKRLASEKKPVSALIRTGCPDLPEAPDIRYVKGDLRSPVVLSELFENCGCLIHLAFASDSAASGHKEAEQVNVNATENLILKAADYGISRVIYVSAASLYQRNGGIITEETPSKSKGSNVYENHKITCENILKKIAEDYDMDLVILRPVSVYGPGDKKFLHFFRTIKSSKIFMIGSGENHIPLVYVEDLVNAITAAIDHPLAIDQEYIVAGSNSSLTLGKMVKQVSECLGTKPDIVPLPSFPALYAAKLIENIFPSFGFPSPFGNEYLSFFTEDLIYSSEKITLDLGVSLNTTPEEGIVKTIEFYRSNRLI
ncbi:MAG: hypothetical protein A2017_01835 [Lentisphaerae bacterium GWF2_44_16]|nr:MAG: hypothetical protein A2017_01835 [Lentisphaerae bacterium GWF2_44_16]